MIAKGRADYNRVIEHVTKIFKDKFNYFRLSKGVMEKLLQIMRMNENPNANKELLLSYKISQQFQSSGKVVNFCLKCFQGHFCLEYHEKKKWGIKCDTCKFRIGCLEKAGAVYVSKEKCVECSSYCLEAQYKENSPFPGGAKTRTACLLCDSAMRSTIVNFFFKQQRQKTPQEIEEDLKRREEQKRIKDEKLALREKEDQAKRAAGIFVPGDKKPDGKKKEKKKGGPNILSAEDKVAEFMRKMHHKDGDEN